MEVLTFYFNIILKMRKILIIFLTAMLIVAFKPVKPVKSIDKMINNEVKSTFLIENYTVESIQVSEKSRNELPIKINDVNFKIIISDGQKVGYYYHGKAFGKVDHFDFLVIFDTNLVIKKVKILIYREDRGGEISSKRWLRQFVGKSATNSFVYEKDIVGISGATISAKSMTSQMDKLMQSIQILSKNKIL